MDNSGGSTARPLHLVRPSGQQAGPVKVEISPVVVFSILDHSMRRDADQERVIGTLVGTRSEDGSEIYVRNCFAVPHNESSDQVEVDMEYHKQMFDLHTRANPREVLVGWYATTSELNTFSALIQNFYASSNSGTFPHPAVHLTLNTDPSEKEGLKINTYISSSVGVTAERAADSCLFLPVPHSLSRTETERSGLEAIASVRNQESRSVDLQSDLDSLEEAVREVLNMLGRVQTYVAKVLDGSEAPNASIGKYLLDTLNIAPSVNLESWEKMFNSHLQDVLLVVYLANTVRTQLDIGSRLTLLL